MRVMILDKYIRGTEYNGNPVVITEVGNLALADLRSHARRRLDYW